MPFSTRAFMNMSRWSTAWEMPCQIRWLGGSVGKILSSAARLLPSITRCDFST